MDGVKAHVTAAQMDAAAEACRIAVWDAWAKRLRETPIIRDLETYKFERDGLGHA